MWCKLSDVTPQIWGPTKYSYKLVLHQVVGFTFQGLGFSVEGSVCGDQVLELGFRGQD